MFRLCSCAAIAVLLAGAALACSGPAPRISALAHAARAGDVPAIRAMIAAGHDPNVVDPGGNRWTPLLHAIHKGQYQAAEALLAAGANVHRPFRGHVSPLMMAVGNGQANIVRLLLDKGADPRADGPGILAVAVRGGALTDIENPLLGQCNAAVVKLVLERDPTLRLPRNVQGQLSLLFARLNNCEEVIKLVTS